VNKPDQQWAERFFRECLKAVGRGHWGFELNVERLCDEDGAVYGDAACSVHENWAKIHVYHRGIMTRQQLENTLAHEAIEVAMSDLRHWLRYRVQNGELDEGWDHVHKAINPLEKVVAEHVRRKLKGGS